MHRALAATALATLLASAAAADPFVEALETALEAYAEGDLQYVEDELAEAQRLLAAMKTAGLAAYLPEPPEGWSREIDEAAGGGMLGFMGGGVMASATYSSPDTRFELTLMADNPMVAQLGMMLGNTAMIAQLGGQIERINRVRFLREDRSLRALIANRILVTAEGAEAEVMIPVLETMDFRAMEGFGG